MATQYIDLDNGNNGNTGADTANAKLTLGQFFSGRSAGDKGIVRFGTTETVSANITMASSGNKGSAIILEADYDNAWGDHVDLSVTATATLVNGSKTVVFSADISGVISAGDVIYASGDDNREYGYEVASVDGDTVTVTLYLPYKGGQAGSGKTMINMGAYPIWNDAPGSYYIDCDNDRCWKFQGIHFKSTSSEGGFRFNTSGGFVFKDVVFTAGGSSPLIYCTDEQVYVHLYKTRVYNAVGIKGFNDSSVAFKAWDCLFDGASTAARGIDMGRFMSGDLYCHESKGYTQGDIANIDDYHQISGRFRGRNCKLQSTTKIDVITAGFAEIYMEDYDNTPGYMIVTNPNGLADADDSPCLITDSTTNRSGDGGNALSLKIIPNSRFEALSELGHLHVMEIPLYLPASEQTVDVYFNMAAADFTTAPTAAEMWMEAEYWGHASNYYRIKKKSTGTITADGTWQSLSVTFTPGLAGVAYIHVWYTKVKEGGKNNYVYVDPLPVVT